MPSRPTPARRQPAGTTPQGALISALHRVLEAVDRSPVSAQRQPRGVLRPGGAQLIWSESSRRHRPGVHEIGGLMFAARRVTVYSVLLVTLALALLLGLRGLPSAAAEGEAAVTVVRELTERRTEYGTSYVLSNGLYRTVLSQAPVHYKDPAGVWQAVDTRLAPSAEGGYSGRRRCRSLCASGPVSRGRHLDARRARGHPHARRRRPRTPPFSPTAAEATYIGRGPGHRPRLRGHGRRRQGDPGARLAPRHRRASASRLAHPGLTLRAGRGDGTWGLYAGDGKEPVFLLGAVNAHDASADEAGEPAWCDAAKLSVAPGKEASTVTVSVPRAWLDDAARLYPVTIDPPALHAQPHRRLHRLRPPQHQVRPDRRPEPALRRDQPEHGGPARRSCASPRSTTTANIPSEAHVSAATFSIRQYEQLGGPHPHPRLPPLRHLHRLGKRGVTWNSSDDHRQAGGPPRQPLRQGGQTWLDITCPGVIQGWVDGSFATTVAS